MQTLLRWPAEGNRRVPLSIYSDADIYQREQERIFRGAAWHYVGLECEVPQPGDFMQSWVGETPVILVRDREGVLRVFVNRCSHRGARVCHQARGNTKVFTCPYHAWSFDLQGALAGVPYRRGVRGEGGMDECFDPAQHGLQALHVACRHGVVFASYAPDMPSLAEYLGPSILGWFDRVCDGRPLQVIGKMRHRVHANWKLQIENVKDTIHAAILHSFFTTFGIWRADQETCVRVDETGRHSVLVSTASFKQASAAATAHHGLDLEDRRMITLRREFEQGTGAVMTLWPNLIFLQQLNCLVMRHVRPDGPHSCIKTWTFFGYAGDDVAMLQQRLMQANLLGPSGLVTIDDNEVLAISQDAAAASPDALSVLEAGQGDRDAEHMITESAIRGFHDYYRKIMEL